MSLNQRRATGTHLSHLMPIHTKIQLMDVLSENGYSLDVSKINNFLSYTAVKYVDGKIDNALELDRLSPNERRNWQGMADYFRTMFNQA